MPLVSTGQNIYVPRAEVRQSSRCAGINQRSGIFYKLSCIRDCSVGETQLTSLYHRPRPVLKLVALKVPLRSFDLEALRRNSLRVSLTPMRNLRNLSFKTLASSSCSCIDCGSSPRPHSALLLPPRPDSCVVVVVMAVALSTSPSLNCNARSTRLRLLRWSVVSWTRASGFTGDKKYNGWDIVCCRIYAEQTIWVCGCFWWPREGII